MKRLTIIITLALAAFAFAAQAQNLSTPQLQTVCIGVKANATANAARLAGDTSALLAWLNGDRSPVVLSWRAAVQPLESEEAATYTTYDTLTAGKRDSWVVFLRSPRDFGKNRNRNWVVDVWGPAIAASVAEAVLLAGTSNASNVQVLLGGTVKVTGIITATDHTLDASANAGVAEWLVSVANCT